MFYEFLLGFVKFVKWNADAVDFLILVERRIKYKPVSETIKGMHDVYYTRDLNIKKKPCASFVLMPVHLELLARLICGGDVLHWCISSRKSHLCQYNISCNTWDYILEYQHLAFVLTRVQPTLDLTLCCSWYGFVAFPFFFVLVHWQKRLSGVVLNL